MMRTLSTAWHTLHIFMLMLLRPAALFARINALPWYRDTLQQWAVSVTGDAPACVLEVGCATGELTHHLANAGHHISGVDAAPAMLVQATKAGAGNARFLQGSVMQLPFETGQFRHVIAASLINVVDDPVGALREMKRVCQSGGSVSVLVPQAGISRKEVALLADHLQLASFSRAAMLFWLRVARKLSTKTLEGYFMAAGFSSLSSQQTLNGTVITVTGSHNFESFGRY